MATQPDPHFQVAKYQKKIADHLGLSNEQLVFEYKDADGGATVLNLITINPLHEQSFLFHSVKALGKVDALEKMLDYVESHQEKENVYTIQWSVRGDSDLHTSYFRGANIYDVLHKFHHGRDMNATVIYSIVLSPIT